eukprot:845151_1
MDEANLNNQQQDRNAPHDINKNNTNHTHTNNNNLMMNAQNIFNMQSDMIDMMDDDTMNDQAQNTHELMTQAIHEAHTMDVAPTMNENIQLSGMHTTNTPHTLNMTNITLSDKHKMNAPPTTQKQLIENHKRYDNTQPSMLKQAQRRDPKIAPPIIQSLNGNPPTVNCPIETINTIMQINQSLNGNIPPTKNCTKETINTIANAASISCNNNDHRTVTAMHNNTKTHPNHSATDNPEQAQSFVPDYEQAFQDQLDDDHPYSPDTQSKTEDNDL